MAIIRKAIIIGVSGISETEGFLPGVYQDTERFYNFLVSEVGGSWDRSEIEVYSYSDSKTIRDRISQIEVDYTVTLFSGHGGAKNTELEDVYLNLTRTDTLSLSNLFNKSKKQLLIIDTCRIIEEDDLSKGSETALDKQIFNKDLNRRSRILYEKQIEESDAGIVIITSCSQNQSASENKEGSYYLRSLIKAGEDFAVSSNKCILDIKQAFNQSLINLFFYPTEQTPELTEGRISVRFPFAVNPNIKQSRE